MTKILCPDLHIIMCVVCALETFTSLRTIKRENKYDLFLRPLRAPALEIGWEKRVIFHVRCKQKAGNIATDLRRCKQTACTLYVCDAHNQTFHWKFPCTKDHVYKLDQHNNLFSSFLQKNILLPALFAIPCNISV